MSMDNLLPSGREDAQSQVPALRQLAAMGYKILTPEKVKRERKGSFSSVILEGVLEKWLRENNKIESKNGVLTFSEGAISSSIQHLKDEEFEGLGKESQRAYELIRFGKTVEQTIKGETKSLTLKYVDWVNPERNVFHAAYEFSVLKRSSSEKCRSDIILFVNGIPFVAIECKSDKVKLEKAIEQHLSYQSHDLIPNLYRFIQVAIVVNRRDGTYGTSGTEKKFWSKWKEKEISEDEVFYTINQILPSDQLEAIEEYFEVSGLAGDRQVSGQDRLIQSLCRPDRLIELARFFVPFDSGIKKIARWQQFFAVNDILKRIKRKSAEGRREGGLVWHTQGSGKSLTMIMLADRITQDPDIINPRILAITDRKDLDRQLTETFRLCEKNPVQAKTGAELRELVEKGTTVVTSIIDKFGACMKGREVVDDSSEIFVLIDEGHRGQYGLKNTSLRKVFPNACFIAFTGTPILKKDKDTIRKFGSVVQPVYNMKDAVEDRAVLPILFEGRDILKEVQEIPLDAGFGQVSEGLSDHQKKQLVDKAKRKEMLQTSSVMHAVAQSVSDHFEKHWKGTGFKAQLVVWRKKVAVQMKESFDEIGKLTSEVIISPPNEHETKEDHYTDDRDVEQRFWKSMMNRFGNEETYNQTIINSFKADGDPELLIVVSKLLTGFDAPRNTVLYIYREIKDHELLQAIARVNRLFPGKDYGYVIDYWGVLGNLDKALSEYDALSNFDQNELENSLTEIKNLSLEVQNLPQRHADLLDVFKTIKKTDDKEAYELFLADEEQRDIFKKRLNDYSRCLANAEQSVAFLDLNPDKRKRYKKDLNFFQDLRKGVRARYSEDIDFKDYEKRIERLLNTYVTGIEEEIITEQVNIFDKENFDKEVKKLEESTVSQADTIAHRTARTIAEKMDEDRYWYKGLAKEIQEAIEGFRNQRLSEDEYLSEAKRIMNKTRNRTGDELPEVLKSNANARPYYGICKDRLGVGIDDKSKMEEISADLAMQIQAIIRENSKRDWVKNLDLQNKMKSEIEDALFDASTREGFKLSFETMDRILEESLVTAKNRSGSQ